VHGGLSSLKFLLHIIISTNLDAGLKDHCKVRTNVSKSSTRQIPSSGTCHQITLESKGCKLGGPWPISTGTYGLGDNKMC